MNTDEHNATQPSRVQLLDADGIGRALRRIAHEIVEQNPDASSLIIAGIPSRGVEVAQRLVENIASIEKVRPDFAVIDVGMHRDDLKLRANPPHIHRTTLPLQMDGRTVVLADDVLFTGRTCCAALDALSEFGRPKRVQLAVLVDRGHRELPIRADYVGKNVPTSPSESVSVRFINFDNEPDGVWLLK